VSVRHATRHEPTPVRRAWWRRQRRAARASLRRMRSDGCAAEPVAPRRTSGWLTW